MLVSGVNAKQVEHTARMKLPSGDVVKETKSQIINHVDQQTESGRVITIVHQVVKESTDPVTNKVVARVV